MKIKELFEACMCNKCNAHFYYGKTGKEIVIWQFFFDYKGKRFQCRWDKNTDTTYLALLDGSNYIKHYIAKFLGSSLLNPNNIIQKMPTIMVFS